MGHPEWLDYTFSLRYVHKFPVSLIMFVPRALRLKGLREPSRCNATKGIPTRIADSTDARDEGAPVQPTEKTNTASSISQVESVNSKTRDPSPNLTANPVKPEYLAQVAAGIELIFTDYAHQESERAKWLQDRYRAIDAEEKCTQPPFSAPVSCLMMA